MTDERCIHVTDGQMCVLRQYNIDHWRNGKGAHAYEPGIPCPTCGGAVVTKCSFIKRCATTITYCNRVVANPCHWFQFWGDNYQWDSHAYRPPEERMCPANCIQGWVAK